ncbi:dihydrofolate reductase [Virgibacillus byunsanensis]|uniref:Dihydrofolate reductase n=1 Tax=Virgibacillus byunsanensis TaxID=570945 RepID=A0ABW3LT39_9BACI
MISLLVAMDRNHVIGLDNDLPWHLPKDLKFFKQMTTGQTIIMGRKTYESMGRALPNRKNIVITSRSEGVFPEEVEVFNDIKAVQELNQANPDKEYFVIGGANIIKQVLSFANRMYITWIDHDFEGDTYFPNFSKEEWNLTSNEKGERDEKNPYDYYFLQYDRK